MSQISKLDLAATFRGGGSEDKKREDREGKGRLLRKGRKGGGLVQNGLGVSAIPEMRLPVGWRRAWTRAARAS